MTKLAVLSMAKSSVSLWRCIGNTLVKWRLSWVMLVACLLLSGCVQYDVEVHFDSQTHGEIVQHIQIGDRLSAFSSQTAQEWLESIKRRTRRLQGKTQKISDQEMIVTIGFNNGAELAQKFNQFFNPVDSNTSADEAALDTGLPQITSQMKVKQNNFLFVLRNRLSYDLDLRSLGVISANGNVLISPGSLLDLNFALYTPWGARSIQTSTVAPVEGEEAPVILTPESSQPENGIASASSSSVADVRSQPLRPRLDESSPTHLLPGNQLVWKLQPGKLNHLEAVFWIPSPIGIGAAIIAIFVATGMYLKYQLFPALGIGKPQTGSSRSPQPNIVTK